MASKGLSRVVASKYFLRSILVILLALFLWRYLQPRFAGDITVDGVAFSFFGIGVYWYGLIIAMAILIGYEFIIRPELARRQINQDKFSTFVLTLVLVALAGARLGFVAQNFGYYGSHPGEIVALWYGGLSIHGAIVFGVLWSWYYAKKIKLEPLDILDIISPSVVFGLAMGRFGNFFNQELIGQPSGVPWKMYVAPDLRPTAIAGSEFFHPVFLYESLLNIIVLAALISIARRKPRSGFVFFAFLGLYSIVRFFVEFYRYSDYFVFWHLTLAQVVSVVLLATSVTAIVRLRQSVQRRVKPVLAHKLS